MGEPAPQPEPEPEQAATPPVEQLFAMLDTDGDGKLSQQEYKAYLRGIGAWGTGSYTDAKWAEKWPMECKGMESTTDGISREGFEGILYGKYRVGKAQSDLDKCRQSLSQSAPAPQPQPQPQPQS